MIPGIGIDSVPELTFVLRAVEIAFRFCDESVVVDLPKFVAADFHPVSGSAASGVCSDQRPMKCGSISARLEFVERNDHVRKIAHESLRHLCDCRASNRR